MDPPLLENVQDLRARIERRFPVYDVQQDDHVVAFFIQPDTTQLETEFEDLRRELKRDNLVPLLKYQGGEHAIFVVQKPTRNFRSVRWNLVLFILTWLTTTAAGTGIYFGYVSSGIDVSRMTEGEYLRLMFSPANWAMGFLFYALPLMTILGVHEMGHYVYTKKHGMEASLPFFIPLPPLLGGIDIGTLGAFISMREPVPNKKALLDIGVAGPIAGFIVAIPILLIGMFLMNQNPVVLDSVDGLPVLGTPLIYNALAMLFNFPENQVIHPTALAGWVGLFVTAINLLPAGQLDGGHMAAALFGERARYFSYAAVLVLLALGIGIPPLGIEGYNGWLIFALLIAFLGMNHPPTLDDVTGVDARRQFVGAATFGLIILCFTPVPIGF